MAQNKLRTTKTIQHTPFDNFVENHLYLFLSFVAIIGVLLAAVFAFLIYKCIIFIQYDCLQQKSSNTSKQTSITVTKSEKSRRSGGSKKNSQNPTERKSINHHSHKD